MGEQDNQVLIELRDICRDFQMGSAVVHALRNVNLNIKKGEYISLIGPSGSGKSTLLNLIGGLIRPTSGQIIVEGIDISTLSDREMAVYRQKKVGFIFQSFNLIPTLTALQNVEFPLIFAGIPPRERLAKATEALKIVGLEERMGHNPTELSGGETQRVSIARALVAGPEILLADEPTGSLDSETGKEIMTFIQKINRDMGQTLIVVTHDRYISDYAQRRAHLLDGQIERIEEVR
ncbi:putative ABC transport system ATP-binding protein [Candidatus Hakubella thermalkaliphila]|uniref:Putative ABC transport system ATP-binding protein n=1 Tax=Candidatus Hakubella thermalkaliphila TaxID=2754717 RepID=A0A6V8Q2S4_9ACTN|nr:ABC transporter ATP-binding protein [Candidatus Hakubella thermalkaliphila]GFP18902.1 putative ABC transport system ATP-binding protein [Candidatus Hakubella thermalkaliphila]GFP29109.1 putative ABC transport system ATP-binding protein [Candidatus Hakubella thermalkaliphila]GFP37486.1 putative ABC transport system ATP-binding protein [Candidatus Hakubella thermalkaliphila]GFP38374.1 putative ABC transport system ATP-binding protein [Candidatus Hakubella thermalkaliphila]GFP41675.1 putative 